MIQSLDFYLEGGSLAPDSCSRKNLEFGFCCF